MEGQLSEHPAGELIRELADAKLSGALRLSRGRVQAVLYFETGALTFGASNLRAHRLSAVLKAGGILTNAQLAKLPAAHSDEELAGALEQRNLLDATALGKVREYQVSHVVRAVLLWTEGTWKFEPRVRLAGDRRIQIDMNRLLFECASHLSPSFVASRFNGTDAIFERAQEAAGTQELSPAESFLLSRVDAPIRLSDMIAFSGSESEESLRTIYALSLAGLLRCNDWRRAITPAAPAAARASKPRPLTSAAKETSGAEESAATAEEIEAQELKRFFARLEQAVDHYEVLDIGRLATGDEIKSAYHGLARSFHPDRFHRAEPELRSRIDSSFARIAQAYEILIDESRRAAYDAKRAAQAAKTETRSPPDTEENADREAVIEAELNRAETSFQTGLSLLQQNRRGDATRFFAEAATLQPRQARYRAHYGRALIGQVNMRRIAEVELKAALALEPENSAYRVMLAELYKALGLRRRAEGEVQRALSLDPKNEAARALLASLKK